jgi:hypothetical protein
VVVKVTASLSSLNEAVTVISGLALKLLKSFELEIVQRPLGLSWSVLHVTSKWLAWPSETAYSIIAEDDTSTELEEPSLSVQTRRAVSAAVVGKEHETPP